MSAEIKISRRDFLKGALAAMGGAALSACGLSEKKSQVVTQEPPLPTPKTETPIETPATTKTLEIIRTLIPKPTVTPILPEVERTPSPQPTITPFPKEINQTIDNIEKRPLNEETKEEVFKIKIREGESLSSILSFYNVDTQSVEDHNSEEVTIKMSSEIYNFPYKKLCVPTVGMSITSWEEEWNLGEPGYGDFVVYTSMFPYSFSGHTLKEDSELGTFAGLRKTQIGDRFYLSRTWMGENGDWIEAEVVDIVKVFSAEEEIMVTNKSNSQLLNFTTCFVESGNSEARIIVMTRVIDYKAPAPIP